MATTTFEAMRATQVTQLQAITPTSIANVPFRVAVDEIDFREWSEDNPEAAFRRFTISDLFIYEPIEVTNTDVEWVNGMQEVVIAYPNNFVYGSENRRDMRDVIREDEKSVNTAIGERGYGNYTDASALRDGFDIEIGDAVSFLVLTYRFSFWRSVA